METTLNMLIAEQRMAELRRTADADRAGQRANRQRREQRRELRRQRRRERREAAQIWAWDYAAVTPIIWWG